MHKTREELKIPVTAEVSFISDRVPNPSFEFPTKRHRRTLQLKSRRSRIRSRKEALILAVIRTFLNPVPCRHK